MAIRVVHVKREPFTHYIGRNAATHGYASRDANLANPFPITAQRTRFAAVAEFYAHAKANPEILERIRALPRDAVLGCWCAPNACHGDAIKRIWSELHPALPTQPAKP